MNKTEVEIAHKNYSKLIIAVSVLIPLGVAVLLFIPFRANLNQEWVKFLPHFNGVINSATVFILLLGLYFIRRKQVANHKASMTGAFILGVIFLFSYVIYHATVPNTSYGGEGFIRYIYYFLLITHILFSIVVVPFVLFAFYFALSNNIDRHKKLVKYTYPIWMYVSVTGVIVYLMISPYYK